MAEEAMVKVIQRVPGSTSGFHQNYRVGESDGVEWGGIVFM